MIENKSSDVQNDNEVLRILSNLFGVRWDRLIQWSAVALASAWLWLSAVPSMAARQDASFELGPIDWLTEGLASLGVDVPAWLSGTPEWLAQSAHAWAVGLLPVIAALCGTCLAKAQRSSGLVVVSVLAMALSMQAESDFSPVLWTLLWTLVPLVPALGMAVLQARFPGTETTLPSQDYLPSLVLQRFVVAGLAPIWQVLLAPVLGVGLIVGMYGASPPAEEPTINLMRTRMRKLRRSGKTLSEAGAADVLGVLIAVLSAESDRRCRQNLAADALFALDEPLGANAVPG